MFRDLAGVFVFILLAGDNGADTIAVEEYVISVYVAGLYRKELYSIGADLWFGGGRFWLG